MKTFVALLILIFPSVAFSLPPDPTPVEPTLNAGAKAVALRSRPDTQNISACGTLNSADTKYILTNDVSASNTCFTITASNVTLDLNGHSVTYGTADCSGSEPCSAGVAIGAFNKSNIQVANGTIMEGAGTCTNGNQNGYNCNPFYDRGGSANVELGGLTISYHADDSSGIYAIWNDNLRVHDCTIVDTGKVIINRHATKAAIYNGGAANGGGNYYNNKIINARHGGIIASKKSTVHNNEVTIASVATNSTGISGGGCPTNERTIIHSNKVIGRGVHPIGIWPACNADVYNNYIDSMNTDTGTEYNGAIGIRFHWETYPQVDIHNNTVLVSSNRGRHGTGITFGTDTTTDKISIYENLIVATSDNGSTKAVAIEISANGQKTLQGSEHISIFENTIKGNLYLVFAGAQYGKATGYPLLIGNRFIKFGDNSGFKTFWDEGASYFDSTMIICPNNDYEGGASPSGNILSSPTDGAFKNILTSSDRCLSMPPKTGAINVPRGLRVKGAQ